MKLEIGKENFRESVLFVKTPISIYLGWISVVTVSNISFYFASLNLHIFDHYEIFWTVLIIFLSLFIGIFMVLKKMIFYLHLFFSVHI